MKFKFIFLLAIAMTLTTLLKAGNDKVQAAYGLDFDMNFDNREFYRSGFSESMTIFGARITPTIGLAVQDRSDVRHSLMVGIDAMKDFGSADKELRKEPVLYYRLEKECGNMDLELYAGMFSRKNMEGTYSEAFFSDSLRFYDNNLEGLLLKFRFPKAYYELGCDWMGQFDATQRERFMIYSSGEGKISQLFSLGYSG